MKIIVTNNPQVREFLHNNKLEKQYDLCWVEGFTENVLCKVRDLCHTNHELLTHPLTGSIKPNQTPYKTVVVEKKATISNMDSIVMAEESLAKALSLLESWPRPDIFKLYLDDFAIIDLGFFKSYLEGISCATNYI